MKLVFCNHTDVKIVHETGNSFLDGKKYILEAPCDTQCTICMKRIKQGDYVMVSSYARLLPIFYRGLCESCSGTEENKRIWQMHLKSRRLTKLRGLK